MFIAFSMLNIINRYIIETTKPAIIAIYAGILTKFGIAFLNNDMKKLEQKKIPQDIDYENIKGIAKFSSVLVPTMGFIYLVVAILIVFKNFNKIYITGITTVKTISQA